MMTALAARIEKFLPTLQGDGKSSLFGISEDSISKCRELVSNLIAAAMVMGQMFLQDMLIRIRRTIALARESVLLAMGGIRKSMNPYIMDGFSVGGMLGLQPDFARSRMVEAYAHYGGGEISTSGIRRLTDALEQTLLMTGGMARPAGDIIIPVYLGGTIIDEVVVSAQRRANLRSGGR